MLRDTKEAFRSLAASPALVAIIVVTLALAIGVNTALFSVLNAVLLRPFPYVEPERLVSVWESNPGQGIEQAQVSGATYLDWRQRSDAFAGLLGAYRHVGATLTGVDQPQRLQTVELTPLTFRTLGVDAAMGRTFADSEETPGSENIVVLGHGSWSGRFGADQQIVGRSIQLDGVAKIVVGVMPRGFEFPPGEPDVELWTPLTLDAEALPSRPHRMYDTVGRLAAGRSLQQAREEMEAIAADIAAAFPESNEGWSVALVPTHEQVVGPIRSTLWVLFGAVGLVLLIGCANVANLLIARSTRTAKDFVVRAALGAGRWRLIRRSLVESLIMALLGGGAGLLIAFLGMAGLRQVLPASVPRVAEVSLDGGVLAFALAITLGSAFLFGTAPALRVAGQNLADALKQGGRGAVLGTRARWLSNAMVVVEIALALVLLVGAGLLLRSFTRLTSVDPGYRTDDVVAVALALPESRYPGFRDPLPFFTELLERVRLRPEVEAAGAVSVLPMSSIGSDFEIPFTVQGLEASSPTERPRADYRAVLPGYFEAMGIPLVLGDLPADMQRRVDRGVAAINETLRDRYFPDVDPIRRIVSMPMAGDLFVVGVVGDIRHAGPAANARPEWYVPMAQLPLREMHVVVYSHAEPAAVAAAVREEIAAMDAQLAPTQIVTIRELLSNTVAQPRFNMAMLGGLALCAAILAGVGIYGVVSNSVLQRTSEIGVRMAMGADASATSRLVVGQAMRTIAIGVMLGTACALGLSRFLSGLLFEIGVTDPTTYVLTGFAVIAIGLLAALIPARRATRIDPLIALRAE